MNDLLAVLLSLSLKSGWAVLAVVLLRFVMKSAPKWTHCLLWSIVGLRLMLPFSVESVLSLVPNREMLKGVVSAGPLDAMLQTATVEQESVGTAAVVLLAVWSIGAAGLLLYAFATYIKMYRRVSVSVRTDDNIYLCDDIDKPFIFGIFRPRICLPSGMPEEQMQFVIRHERAHLKRCDHWWKPLSFLLLAVHWFNPLLWLAYKLFGQDVELACDEKTVKNMDITERRLYSETLLLCGMERRMRLMCPVAFGEVGIQERIVSVLSYRKQAFWRAAAASAVCVLLAVCFLTDPVTAKVVEEIEQKAEENASVSAVHAPYIARGRTKWTALYLDSMTGEYIPISDFDFILEDGVNVISNGISVAELKCCPEVPNAGMEITYTMSRDDAENAVCEYSDEIHLHRIGSTYAVARCKNCGSDLGAFYVGKGHYCEYAKQALKE